jgi:hypothetical protein
MDSRSPASADATKPAVGTVEPVRAQVAVDRDHRPAVRWTIRLPAERDVGSAYPHTISPSAAGCRRERGSSCARRRRELDGLGDDAGRPEDRQPAVERPPP